MKKWFRTAALMAALAATAGSVTVAAPQEKKAPQKKDEKKADDKKGEKKADEKKSAVGTVEVYKKNDKYRYRVKNADGKTVAIPLANMGWETKEECLKAIDELKATLNKAIPTEVKE